MATTGVQARSGHWAESDDDEEPALYATDEFRIRVMKVLRCSKKYCHDWTRCPFAHPGEKATRRDPMSGVYTGIACPDMRRDQRCPRGHYCPYAHNVFEYWLHPTRYRTALCRDIDKCKRKICFFAHEVSELRRNYERPYVSPEQLVAATEAAAADPRVQAKYLAAGEQKKSGKSGTSGLFTDDQETGATLEELQNLGSLTLPGPGASAQKQEAMQAFSSLMRGDVETSPPRLHPTVSLDRDEEKASTSTSGLPPLIHGQAPARSFSDVSGMGSAHPSVDSRLPRRFSSIGGSSSVAPIHEASPAMFPQHLNTMVQAAHSQQSWGSQQNLLNAAAHLSNDPVNKENTLWSTPRGPLDMNALYSTTSTVSDRQPSLEAATRLELLYKQKAKKRMGKRQPREVNPPPPFFAGHMGAGFGVGPQHNFYQQNLTPPPRMSDAGGGAASGMYSGVGGGVDYARLLQEQAVQQQQQQTYLHSLQQDLRFRQQQQQAYEQQLRAQLQNAQAMQPQVQNQAAVQPNWQGGPSYPPETGFDLRFGGLGENQGVLGTPEAKTYPTDLRSDISGVSLYSGPTQLQNLLSAAEYSNLASPPMFARRSFENQLPFGQALPTQPKQGHVEDIGMGPSETHQPSLFEAEFARRLQVTTGMPSGREHM